MRPFKAGLRLIAPPLVVLAALAALGLLALLAVDALVPRHLVAGRFAAAAAGEMGRDAGGHPADKLFSFGVELNFFSDCMVLSMAAAPPAGPPLALTLRSRAVLWTPGTALCPAAAAAVAHPEAAAWFDYSRYWHGSRVVIDPAMAWLGWRGTQGLMAVMLVGALVALMLRLLARHPWPGVAGALAVLLVAGLPVAAATPTHGVSLAVLFGVGAAFLSVEGPEARRLAAFAGGAAYNYADFLYNPAALALLLGGLVALEPRQEGWAARGRAGAAAALATLLGYGAMWGAKWLLVLAAAPLAPGTAVPLTDGDLTRWVAGGSAPYVPLQATAALLATTFDTPLRALAYLAAALPALWQATRAPAAAATASAALLGPALVAVLAIEGAAGHSLAHQAFTYRVVPVGLALWLLALGRDTAPWQHAAPRAA